MPTVFLALGAPYARSMYSRARAGACTRVACTPKSLEASCPAGDVRGEHCRQQVEAMGQSLVAGTGAQRRLGREGRPHDCSRCMTAVCLIALQMVAYVCRACCCVYVCARTHVCVCKGVRACEHVCVCVCGCARARAHAHEHACYRLHGTHRRRARAGLAQGLGRDMQAPHALSWGRVLRRG